MNVVENWKLEKKKLKRFFCLCRNAFFFFLVVQMKDRCKLFCRVAGAMMYYQLKDRVIDGTPCGPDTYDICVQGLCRVYTFMFCDLFVKICKKTAV